MELLRKTIVDRNDHRNDNGDKKPLFTKDLHPHIASFHREQWAFIADETIKENIAYQMQYLEFMICLYNEYQIYLTVESLICKDIMVIVAGVIEAALFDLIESARKAMKMSMEDRTDFTTLLGMGYHEYGFLTRDQWHFFHDLRKVRNYVHLKAADFKEYAGYTVDEANSCVRMLDEFRTAMAKSDL
ncbi:MAG TPA: hypothetical protein VMR99_00525 [Candidatus Paceibacterota bacterium]|nr:hypothetical protein [Candidatus Paceibacterota bacterium]